MTENIRHWLRNLINHEIESVQGMISNEKLWMFGSQNEEEESMHIENMAEYHNYLKVLNSILSSNGL